MQALQLFSSWYQTRKALTAPPHILADKRERLWKNLQPTLAKTPALAPFAGSALADFPVIKPADMREDISRWNSAGISHADACQAAAAAETGGSGEVTSGIIAGYSTGTSGTKGVFLASARERAVYAGQSIAKLLPLHQMLSGVRVLLFLRANSRLYSDGKGARLFDFRYCPLSLSPQEKLAAAKTYDPHILIAPAHVLAELAGQGFNGASLKQCFYGAEPMGDIESDWVGQTIGKTPAPIYQATEGFLGFTCRHGHLHLNEDSLMVDTLPVKGTDGVQLIVTDLLRTSQPIVRVLLDDFIEPSPLACSCGFAGRTIRPVAGRVQHLWRIHGKVITPRQVTHIMETTLGAAAPWAAHAAPDHATLYLPQETQGPQVSALQSALRQGLLPADFPIVIRSIETMQKEHKRNRIRWHG